MNTSFEAFLLEFVLLLDVCAFCDYEEIHLEMLRWTLVLVMQTVYRRCGATCSAKEKNPVLLLSMVFIVAFCTKV